MNLLVAGINHQSAPLALRERVAFAAADIEPALQDLVTLAGVGEVAMLSTCNRTELYLCADSELDWQPPLHALAQLRNIDGTELCAHAYFHRDAAAVEHMVRVAAGLDSMIVGEPQIFGQIKSAWAVAQEAATVGPVMGQVFPHVFSVAKKVRAQTAIGENPVSVAYTAVSLTRHLFSDLSGCTALLIGAGEMIDLVAKHLRERGIGRLVIANRTLAHAHELAEQYQAEAVMLADVPESLASSDIVVSSTGSQLPVLGKGAVESALKRRKHKPIMLIDIAVPRDIESEVGDLADAYLYTIDDLRDIVDDNRRARADEASKADAIIEQGVEAWCRAQREVGAVGAVRAYRDRAEQLRRTELEKALRALGRGDDASEVLQRLSRDLTNKLLHHPSTRIRSAAAEGEAQYLDIARDLLGIEDNTGSSAATGDESQ